MYWRLSILLVIFMPRTALASGFSPELAPFSVVVGGEELSHKISSLFVLPNDLLVFEPTVEKVRCIADEGVFISRTNSECRWQAPSKPGAYLLTLRHTLGEIKVQTFVMVPSARLQDGLLNGYRIGSYPSPGGVRNKETYSPPRGFIEVTAATENLAVSPHFTLGQFLCKQESGYPKYLVLKEKLLSKLEQVLEEANRNGLRTDTFFVMSGYRTPHYNKLIDNVRFSRHMFGDAADIFIPHSSPEHYSTHGYSEVSLLNRLVGLLEQKPLFKKFIGGRGVYRATSNHPPFMHVDVRGWPAQW